MTRVTCPHCGSAISVQVSSSDRITICSSCGARLRLSGPVHPDPPEEVILSPGPEPVDEIILTPGPEPVPSFAAVPYRPRSYVPLGGLISVIFKGSMLAVLVGAIVGVVRMWFYLPFLFPLFSGLVLGILIRLVCRSAQVRSPSICGLIGACFGCLAFLAIYEVEALQQGEVNPIKHLDALTVEGVTLKKLSRDRETHYGYVGSWIFFVVEALVLTLTTGFLSWYSGREPLCVPCREWKIERPLGSVDIPPQRELDRTRAIVKELFQLGKLDQLDALAEQGARHPSSVPFNLTAHVCPCCDRSIDVDLLVPSGEKHQPDLPLLRMTYPVDALPALMRICGRDDSKVKREIERRREIRAGERRRGRRRDT